MNRRKVAIQTIVAEVAREGIAGHFAIRAYVESHMSAKTFHDAIRLGQRIYERNHQPEVHRDV